MQPAAKKGALKNLGGLSPGAAGKPGPSQGMVGEGGRKECRAVPLERRKAVGGGCSNGEVHRNQSVRQGRGNGRAEKARGERT